MKEKCLVAIIAVAYAMLPDDKRKRINNALKCVANAKDTVRIVEFSVNKLSKQMAA